MESRSGIENMKVICPKCQFENEADTRRVVCGRCATIIEVRLDQGPRPESKDSNGMRLTAQLPFAAKPGNNQAAGNQQPNDVYATRIGDELDDVLDIPRPSQSSYQSGYESSPIFDDVFATPGYDSSTYDYPPPERSSNPLDNFQMGQQSVPRQRQTQDYADSSDMEYMGWPMLPENSTEEEERVSSFSSGRGGLLARIMAFVLFVGVAVFGAYYFFGDQIKQRWLQEENLSAGGIQGENQQAENTSPTPSSGQGEETKPVDESTKTDNTSAPPAASAPSASSAVDASKTANPAPVITPKPPNAAEDKSNGKLVDIPPLTSRSGSSDPIKTPGQPVASSGTANRGVLTIPNKGNLTIQVGSYKEQKEANERQSRLKASGIEATVVRAEVPGKGIWYRVRIGAFTTREEAASFGNQLRAKGVQDFIVTSINK
jgi:cell division septation protein DedD